MDEPDLSHPANTMVLHYMARRAGVLQHPLIAAPSSVPDPYYTLGAHPDVVERLWQDLNEGLPADCRWIVRGFPSLVHPETGIIFAYAGGTTYALRLPEAERRQALQRGAKQVQVFPAYPTLGITGATVELGDEWVFGRWYKDEDWWCLAAYEAATAASP
jgi:hypothetical protein